MKSPQTNHQTTDQHQDFDDLIANVQNAAKNLKINAPSVGTSKGKAYEVWLMLEIAYKLKKENFVLLPHGCDDKPAKIFRVSGSPANMPAHNGKVSKSPCHFKFYKSKNKVFELHLGLKVSGCSGADHEVDLLIIEHSQALALRLAGGGPFDGNLIVALELKAFDKEGKLPHDISRAFLGVGVDVGGCWFFMINKVIHYAAIFTSADLYRSSELLLSHHSIYFHKRVDPNEKANVTKSISAIYNEVVSY